MANMTIFDVDMKAVVGDDYYAEFCKAIEADRLAIAEAVLDKMFSICPGRHTSMGNATYPDECWCDHIEALDLADIVKGNQ